VAKACGIYEALWLARLHQRSASALYLHIPFCVSKCAYCDFASWKTDPHDPQMRAYTASLQRLLSQASEARLLDRCETAYIGGGTPSLLGIGLADLVGQVRLAAPRIGEMTCEANPDSLSDELLAALPQAGCTRLSLGVQSLDDAELKVLGRVHTADRARDRLMAAVAAGLDVSCDLMCAIPGQTDESWEATLRGAVACGVDHVSVYPLQIEEGTPFDRMYGDGPTPWNDTEVQARRMRAAFELLEQEGYRRYEVASYARGGKECAHNQAYWTARPYLGIGCGASSMLTREGYEALRGIAPQLPSLSDDAARVRLTCTSDRQQVTAAQSWADLSFDIEVLSAAQATAEDLMLAMRMVRGTDPGLLEHARATLDTALVDSTLEACEHRGLARRQGLTWVPTDDGWLLGNELYGALWDLAPGEVSVTSCP